MKEYKYKAFISYQRKDERWASWFQKKLEYYKMPIEIAKAHPEAPHAIRPIFKDTTNLNGATLTGSINAALEDSKYLIVICSPNVVRSRWVSKEVQFFIDNDRSEYIIPVIVDGVPHSDIPGQECLPENIRGLKREDELLCINIDDSGRETAVIRIVSRMTGISFDSLWQRYRREERTRNNIRIAVLSALLLLASMTAFLFMSQNRRIKEQNRQVLMTQSVAVADLADRLTAAGDPITAAMLSLEVLPEDIAEPDRPYTTEAERALRNAMTSRGGFFRGHHDRVYSVAITKDNNILISGSADNTIRIWDTRNGGCLKVLHNNNGSDVRRVEISPDESLFMSMDESDTIRIWDLKTLECVKEMNCTVEGESLSYAGFDGNDTSIVSFHQTTMGTWSISSGKCTSLKKYAIDKNYDPFGQGKSIIGEKYALLFYRFKGSLFDRERNVEVGTFSPFTAMTDDGSLLAEVNKGTLDIYDSGSGKLVRSMEVSADLNLPSISPDGKYVALASSATHAGREFNSRVEIYDVSTGERISSYPGHSAAVESLSWSADGKFLLTASNDDCIGMWSINTFPDNIKEICPRIHGWSFRTDYSPDGRLMVYSQRDTIKISNVDLSDAPYIIISNIREGLKKDYYLQYLSFTPDRKMIIAAFGMGFRNVDPITDRPCFKFWDADTGELIRLLHADSEIENIAFSPGGELFAATSMGIETVKVERGIRSQFTATSDVYLYDWSAGTLLAKLSGHTKAVNDLVFTDEGSKLVTCSMDNKIIVWDVNERKQVRTIEGHEGSVASVILSPDNSRIISSSSDKTIREWDIETGECLSVIGTLDKWVHLRNSNNGEYFASYSAGGAIRLWSGQTMKLKHTYDIRLLWTDISFSYDDRLLYATDISGNLHVFDTQHGGLIAVYKNMGISICCNPARDLVMCEAYQSLVQLEIEPLQVLIERAKVLYHDRELSNEERRKYYLTVLTDR